MWIHELKTDTLRPGIVLPLDGYFLGYGTAPRVGTLVVTRDTTERNLTSHFYFFCVCWPSIVALRRIESPLIEEPCVMSSVKSLF